MSLVQKSKYNIGDLAGGIPMVQARAKYWTKKTGQPFRINNLDDYLRLWYPQKYSDTYYNDIKKADDPVLTSTSGFLTTTFGERIFSQINHEQSVYGALPIVPWDRRGWRVTATRHATGGSQAENATNPETDQFPAIEISAAPKTIMHTFEASLQARLESKLSDDTYGDPMDAQRPLVELEHGKEINEALLQDADTLAGDNPESLDRLTMTTAGVTALGYTAGDEDIFGIDKSVTTALDLATLDHNSGTDRDLTIKLIDDNIATVRRFWVNSPQSQFVLIMSDITYERVRSELQAQQRFEERISTSSFTFGSNGIGPAPRQMTGRDVAFDVNTYRGFPILIDNDTQVDTIGRIYGILMGPDATFWKSLMLPQYFEAGISGNGNPWLHDKLNDKAAIVQMGALNSANLPANFQLRDLQ